MTRLFRTMAARSSHEPHRAATPLELFFDLVFVVAIAQAGAGLHHAIAENHALQGLVGYLMVFFALWWAWINFTWFASAYDCDDVPYRLAVFVQMAGALVLAAGIADMFEHRTPNTATVGGYVIMRAAIIFQWVRAALSDPERRRTAWRYAIGAAFMQVAWVVALVFQAYRPVVLVALIAGELTVPAWAERARATTWHPHHIAERYGLLTLIVLGESVLAATLAIQAALAEGNAIGTLLPIIVGGMLIMCSMWWVYFDRPVHDLLTSYRRAFLWGYGHYFVFMAAAAVGAGLAVAVDHAVGKAPISTVASGAAVAVPVALFLTCLWWIHDRPEYRRTRAFGPVVSMLVLLTPLTGQAVLATGVLLVAMITAKQRVLNRAG